MKASQLNDLPRFVHNIYHNASRDTLLGFKQYVAPGSRYVLFIQIIACYTLWLDKLEALLVE